MLQNFFQGDIRTDEDGAIQELLRAILVRAQFVPAARHALGWRGLRQSVTTAVEGWTARIEEYDGVFGICFNGSKKENGWVIGAFNLSYFPAADEAMVERCSLRAAACSQRPDYMSLIRDFLQHEEMVSLFYTGTLFLALDTRQKSLYLGMQSLTAQRTIARKGIKLPHNGSEIWAVNPGGYDQNFPSLSVTQAFFNVLAASLSFNLEQPPGWLIERRFPGIEIIYDDKTTQNIPAPDIEEVLTGLGYGDGRFDALFETLAGTGRVPIREIRWLGKDAIPPEYSERKWWTAPHLTTWKTLNKKGLGIDERPPLIILTGFLGAGKTSFLQHFIEYQTQRSRFIAVIQNEIGNIGLDGKLLDYKVTEIDEGCVCCSLAGNLKRALQEILSNFQPDFIVLETTGAANPFNLLDEIRDVEDLVRYDCTATVVDAVNLDHALSNFQVAVEQIKAADVLLLNKCDLATEASLQKACKQIRNINPKAMVFMTERGDLNPSLIFDVDDRWAKKYISPDINDSELSVHHSHIHDGLWCKTLYITGSVNRDEFLSLVKSLTSSIFRIKGIVEFEDTPRPMLFQYVAGRFELSLFPSPDIQERFLTVIGQGKDSDIVNDLASKGSITLDRTELNKAG